jgi:hypothetical protein
LTPAAAGSSFAAKAALLLLFADVMMEHRVGALVRVLSWDNVLEYKNSGKRGCGRPTSHCACPLNVCQQGLLQVITWDPEV